MRNRRDRLVSLELDEARATATPVGEASSPEFDEPTTVAQLGADLWAVNARIGTDATPETDDWTGRVDTPKGVEQ